MPRRPLSGTRQIFPKHFPRSFVSPVNPNPSDESPTSSETRERFVERAMEEFESALIGYAATILHDIDLARDVAQDTFLRLCEQEPAKVEKQLKAWLFTVCRNRAFDVLRKQRRVEPIDEVRWKKVAGDEMQPDETLRQRERLEKAAALLDRLTENQREVIILKFQQGLSYREISEVTGLSTGNIGFLIHTGLKRMRDLLPADI